MIKMKVIIVVVIWVIIVCFSQLGKAEDKCNIEKLSNTNWQITAIIGNETSYGNIQPPAGTTCNCFRIAPNVKDSAQECGASLLYQDGTLVNDLGRDGEGQQLGKFDSVNDDTICQAYIITHKYWCDREPPKIPECNGDHYKCGNTLYDIAMKDDRPEIRKDLHYKAIDEYKKALANNPKDVKALYNIGIIYIRWGEPTSASMQFREILKIDPANAEAQYMIGYTIARRVMEFSSGYQTKEYFEAKNYALKELQLVIDKFPNTEWANKAKKLMENIELNDKTPLVERVKMERQGYKFIEDIPARKD